MITEQEFLDTILEFCRTHGIRVCDFGQRSAGNPNLVGNLRKSVLITDKDHAYSPRLVTVRRVLKWMEIYEDNKAKGRSNAKHRYSPKS